MPIKTGQASSSTPVRSHQRVRPPARCPRSRLRSQLRTMHPATASAGQSSSVRQRFRPVTSRSSLPCVFPFKPPSVSSWRTVGWSWQSKKAQSETDCFTLLWLVGLFLANRPPILTWGSHFGFRADRQHTTDRCRTQCGDRVFLVFYALFSERRSRRPTLCNQEPKCRKEQSSNRLPTYVACPALVSSKFTPKMMRGSPSWLPSPIGRHLSTALRLRIGSVWFSRRVRVFLFV